MRRPIDIHIVKAIFQYQELSTTSGGCGQAYNVILWVNTSPIDIFGYVATIKTKRVYTSIATYRAGGFFDEWVIKREMRIHTPMNIAVNSAHPHVIFNIPRPSIRVDGWTISCIILIAEIGCPIARVLVQLLLPQTKTTRFNAWNGRRARRRVIQWNHWWTWVWLRSASARHVLHGYAYQALSQQACSPISSTRTLHTWFMTNWIYWIKRVMHC